MIVLAFYGIFGSQFYRFPIQILYLSVILVLIYFKIWLSFLRQMSQATKQNQSVTQHEICTSQKQQPNKQELDQMGCSSQEILNEKTYLKYLCEPNNILVFLINSKNNQDLKEDFQQASHQFLKKGEKFIKFACMYENDSEQVVKFANSYGIDGQSIKVFGIKSQSEGQYIRYVLRNPANYQSILQFVLNHQKYQVTKNEYITRKSILKLTPQKINMIKDSKCKVYLFNKDKDQQLTTTFKEAVEQYRKQVYNQNKLFFKFANSKIEKEVADNCLIDPQCCALVLIQQQEGFKKTKYVLKKRFPIKQQILNFLTEPQKYKIKEFDEFITDRVYRVSQQNYQVIKKFKRGLYLFNDGDNFDLYSNWISVKNQYSKLNKDGQVVFVQFINSSLFDFIGDSFNIDWRLYPIVYVQRQISFRQEYFSSIKKSKYIFKPNTNAEEMIQFLLKQNKPRFKICQILKQDPIVLINYQSEASKMFQNEDALIFMMFNLEDSEQLHNQFSQAATQFSYPEERPVIFGQVRKQIRQVQQFCKRNQIEYNYQQFLVFDGSKNYLQVMTEQITKSNILNFFIEWGKKAVFAQKQQIQENIGHQM